MNSEVKEINSQALEQTSAKKENETSKEIILSHNGRLWGLSYCCSEERKELTFEFSLEGWGEGKAGKSVGDG